MKRNYRRAVSPVIAVVLLIALTVAASAVIWAISNNLLGVNKDKLILDSYGVADTDGNDLGDFIRLYVRNIGAEDSVIDSASLYRDGVHKTTWTLVASSYTITSGSVGMVELQSLTGVEQVNADNDVSITLESSTTNSISTFEIAIPSSLSALPIIYEGGGFNNIDINSQGWATYTYNTHGGGPGIYVDNGDVLFDTNDDMLFYLKNDSYSVKNGIISADFLWGDNDGIGIVFRVIDELNYYWVGFTEDHNGPANRASEQESTFDGPWFNFDGRFELHKLVNGVDTILANGTTSGFTVTPGTPSNPTGPYGLKVSFSGDSISFEVNYNGGNYEELFSITDTTFQNAGYFGVFSLAADGTRLDNFGVTA